MKNALILHGTNNDSQKNWFQWLSGELQKRGFKTWVPDLPGADCPNPKIYNEFLLNSQWDFNSESLIVGHSSGAVEILNLLQHLPDNVSINTAILVGAFMDDLGAGELRHLFDEEFNFEKLKTKAQRFIFIHSDNDPYCPLEHAEYLSEKLGAELIVLPGEAHFSISTAGDKYKEFPLLIELISQFYSDSSMK